MTKKYRRLFWLFTILSLLLNIAAPAYYIFDGLLGDGIIVEKVALSASVFIVIMLSAVAYVNKTTMRSRIWILLLGLYVCLDTILTPLLIIAITQILDEWIINPLAKSYRNKLTINKQIDKRMEYV